MEYLEDLKHQIEDYLKQQEFNVFYGHFPSEGFPEIFWNKEEEWKGFLQTAKNEGIKTIILDLLIFDDSFVEPHLKDENLVIDERKKSEIIDFNKKLRGYDKFLGKLCQIRVGWIKDGVIYGYLKTADWMEEYDGLTSEKEIEEGKKGKGISKDIIEKSENQLAEEMIKWIDKEFPNILEDEYHTIEEAKNSFWAEKGIEDTYEVESDISDKLDKVENIVDKEFSNREREREKKLLPTLVDECVKWARDQGIKKLFKYHISEFLDEKGISLSRSGEDSLCTKVNHKLRKGI